MSLVAAIRNWDGKSADEISQVYAEFAGGKQELHSIEDSPPTTPEIIVCGAGNYGSEIIERLLRAKKRVAVVDFNPEIYRHWLGRNTLSYFGDILIG